MQLLELARGLSGPVLEQQAFAEYRQPFAAEARPQGPENTQGLIAIFAGKGQGRHGLGIFRTVRGQQGGLADALEAARTRLGL